MLTVEEIKKACEFADGYSTHYQKKWNSDTIRTPLTTEITFLDNWDKSLSFKGDYPLFLQRVIEGINNKQWKVKQENNIIDIYSILAGSTVKIKTISAYTPDQAKVKAIKYILEQI